MTFGQELTQLINKHSLENQSNIPDFILAKFMANCLDAFNLAMKERNDWYRRDLPDSTTEGVFKTK